MRRGMSSSLASRAVDAADELLAGLGVPVSKVIDPLDPAGFARIVARLERELAGAAGEAEADAMRAAFAALDVDWVGMTVAQREAVVLAARTAIAAAGPRAMPRIEQVFEARGPAIYGDAREAAIRRFSLDVAQTLSLRDHAAERFVRASNANFVRDQYGRRADDLTATAREIVARGLEEGRGSGEIAADLALRLGDRVARGDGYWQVVATQFANSARTYSQINSFKDAGIEEMVFVAVLDEVTTDICRFLHGQVFQVDNASTQLNRLASLENPDDVVNVAPWYREGRDEDGNRIIYFERSTGDRQVVAQVDRSGRGVSDDVGEYSRTMSARDMQAGSVPYPPLHMRCRSNLEPRLTG